MVAAEGKETLVTCIIVTVIACIIVALRLYSRMVLVGGVGWDDLIITSSLILICVLAVITSQRKCPFEFRHGLGTHVWENPPEETATLFQYVFASILIYLASLCLTKLSILLQYLRIFGTQPTMRVACYATIVFVCLYSMVAGVMNIFDCKPVHYFWTRALDPTSGSCLNFEAVWFTHASINIFSDLLIMVLPMPVLKNLKINRRQKMALMAIFAFGSFGCVTAILRLKALARVSKSADVTYDNMGSLLWSTVECNVAIMCASLPSLKIIVSRYFPRLLSSIGSGSRSNPGTPGRFRASRSWRAGFGSLGNNRTGGSASGAGAKDESGNSELYTLKQLSEPQSHAVHSPHLHGRDRKEKSRRRSEVKTKIGKARSLDDDGGSDSNDEANGGGGGAGNIMVKTIMSQQRERASSFFSLHTHEQEHDTGASDATSMAESERRFFRRVP